ncbi:hypothetical protein [Halorarum salinum]|uniref:Uncharacterized protein n=1 Tax=Halorarum salinum TaxID=2743089 RepID=A0A7D5QGD9_9EURY|nr:hypothetical protein [Halobaculum salinum]QLG61404.1 hypothetical protein HUG12_06515 [Halobaculum salinum]
MSIRNAVGQSWVLTALAVGFGAWLVVIAFRTMNNMESVWASSAGVGYTAVSGLVGLAVMVAALALLFVLFGEIGESDPGPEPWMPEEER